MKYLTIHLHWQHPAQRNLMNRHTAYLYVVIKSVLVYLSTKSFPIKYKCSESRAMYSSTKYSIEFYVEGTYMNICTSHKQL